MMKRNSWETSGSYGGWSFREFIANLPVVTRTLLFAIVGVFLIQNVFWYGFGQEFYEGHIMRLFALEPRKTIGSSLYLWQLITYLFMHSTYNLLHLIFNVIVLAIFGPEVERAMGTRRFAVLYFVSGIAAGLTSCIYFSSPAVIGASGAVLGVLAAFASLFPDRVIYLFMIFPMKAKHLVLLIAGMEILNTAMGNRWAIASLAHIGGFIAGFLFMRYEWTVRSLLLRSIERHYDRELETDKAVRERVDFLLSKVSKEGIGSLTWRERTFLKKASKRFKKQSV